MLTVPLGGVKNDFGLVEASIFLFPPNEVR